MIIHWDEDINEDLIKLVIESYNTCVRIEDTLTIYITSPGGSTWYSEVLIDLINTHKDITKLVVYGSVQSAAVILFLKSTCERKILPETFFMIHSTSWSASIKEGGLGHHNLDKFKFKHMKEYAKISMDMYEQFVFTADELSEYREGREIYISFSRLKKIFKEETK